jgi:hypothetical protein
MSELRVLTLTQPWATLIALGVKTIETRTWTQSYHRGPLLIRAAKTFPAETPRSYCRMLCEQQAPFVRALTDAGLTFDTLPLGAIVARATLTDIEQMPASVYGAPPPGIRARWLRGDEIYFGNYEPGYFGWLLDDITALPEAVPCGGGLGLRFAARDVVEAVEAVLA